MHSWCPWTSSDLQTPLGLYLWATNGVFTPALLHDSSGVVESGGHGVLSILLVWLQLLSEIPVVKHGSKRTPPTYTTQVTIPSSIQPIHSTSSSLYSTVLRDYLIRDSVGLKSTREMASKESQGRTNRFWESKFKLLEFNNPTIVSLECGWWWWVQNGSGGGIGERGQWVGV